jgi:MFS transporter, YNFM family, putative membrane transport protein
VSPEPGPGTDAAGDASTLRLLAVAGFASLVSMRMCEPMLPALAAAFRASNAEAAAVVSWFAVTYGLAQLVYGPLGDRFGKPRVIAVATAWCTLAALAAAMAPSLPTLTLARAAMGAGAAAIVPLALAWIGDTVPMQQRPAALARYSGAVLAGITVGAWAGGLMTETLGWRAAFVVVAPLFAAVSLALWRRSGASHGAATIAQRPYVRRLAELLTPAWSRTVLAAVFVEGVFGFGFLAFVPTVLHDRFALQLSHAGAILALFALGGLAFSRLAPLVLARFAPPAQARAGAALMALGYALLAAMPHWSWALAALPMAGFGFFAFHNTLQTIATQLSTSSRGLAVSMFGCCLFLGQSVGVVAAAQVFANMHPAWGFGVAGVGLTALSTTFAKQLQRQAPR